MNQPRKLLIAGDTHGNTGHVIYLFEQAENLKCDAIFQLGDFGYWEHELAGEMYLARVSENAVMRQIPVYWIDGNHENHRLLRAKYADCAKTPEGFWVIRPNVFYVPRGTRWTWRGHRFMGFGGAISPDKDWRIRMERKGGVGFNGKPVDPVGQHTLWWPEEQASVAELAYALEDPDTPLDVLFTHDKPRSSNPQWGNRDLSELWPQQDMVQTMVRVLKPKLLVHGHLHHRYSDRIRCGDNGAYTKVEGLASDVDRPKTLSWTVMAL